VGVVPVLLLVAGCSDPFGVERERLLVEIEMLESECANLEFIVVNVDELLAVSAEVTRKRKAEVERLGATDGCGPCAEHLDARYAPHYTEGQGPAVGEPPASATSMSKGDALTEIEEIQAAWVVRRDDLRRIAENKDSHERDLEAMVELESAWDDPACEPAACQQVREACREGS